MEHGHTHVTLLRDAHLFSNRPRDVEKLEQRIRVIRLAPDQIFHAVDVGENADERSGNTSGNTSGDTSDGTSGHPPGDQPAAPPAEMEFVIRRGKLRASRFLPDGREMTLAVLQAGAAFTLQTADESDAPDPEADRYDLDDIVLMALGEGELWAAPEGTLRLEQP